VNLCDTSTLRSAEPQKLKKLCEPLYLCEPL